MQGKRYTLREYQDVACAAAAKRFGGLHGSLPARLVEVRGRLAWLQGEQSWGWKPLVRVV